MVEARRRRVAAVVQGDRALGEPGRQRGPIRGVVHQAALVEVVEEGEHRRHRPRQAGPGSSPIWPGCPVRRARDAGEWLPPMSRVARSLACVVAFAAALARVLVHVAGRRAPRGARRSSRRPSTPPTARSCTPSTPRRTARSSRSSRSRAHVRNAVIAIEDERYYRHNGVDVRAVLRAARTNAAAGDVEQGGSTITQQYVKQEILAGRARRRWPARCRRPRSPSSSSGDYSKDRILELYLNAIYFGNGAYGIEAAAHQYFGKPATDLTVAEGALIAGLIQRPGATDPFDEPGGGAGAPAARARPDARQRLHHRATSGAAASDAPVAARLVGRARPPSATRPPTSSRR